jgi:hypothetical protein
MFKRSLYLLAVLCASVLGFRADADIFYAASNYSSGLAGTVTRQGKALTVYPRPYAGLNGDAAGFTFLDHDGNSWALTRERAAGKDDTVRIFNPANLNMPLTTFSSLGASNIHAAASIGDYLYLATYESYNGQLEDSGEIVRVDMENMENGYYPDKSYHYASKSGVTVSDTVRPHGEALHIEGDKDNFKVYALFGLSTNQALAYDPTEIVVFDEELNREAPRVLEVGGNKGLNAVRMAYYGGKLYVACMGGYQGPNSWGDIWEVDIRDENNYSVRQVLDGNDMTNNASPGAAIGMYGIQFAPDGTAYILCGSYSAGYNFTGMLYVTTAKKLASSGDYGKLMATYTAQGGSSGFSWDILYDKSSGALWSMVGKALEVRNPNGTLIAKLTPGQLGDNIYSISEILPGDDEAALMEVGAADVNNLALPEPEGSPNTAIELAAADFGVTSQDFAAAFREYLYEDGEYLRVSEQVTSELAEKLYGVKGAQAGESLVVSADVSVVGNIAAIPLKVSGKWLRANRADSVQLMKVISYSDDDNDDNDVAKKLTYVSAPDDYGDGKFTILNSDGEPYSGALTEKGTYTLVLFIKDGGDYDADGDENGAILDPTVPVDTRTGSSTLGGDSGAAGGGCSSGVPALTLVFVSLGAYLTARRPKRR